jgi:aspartate kinase
MLVLKFGGTSVQDPAAIRRAAAIVRAHGGANPVVVVSAMAGVTNALVEAGAAARDGDPARAHRILDPIVLRHHETAEALVDGAARHRLSDDIGCHVESIRRAIDELPSSDDTGRAMDALLAQGELLSSHLVAAGFTADGLEARCVDIRPLMTTNADHGRALVDAECAAPRLRAGLVSEPGDARVTITQGFIGATADGVTTTIGRGGSDLTAAIVGAALDADEVQIWTDVDGIMTTDPRVVPEARLIAEISFAEAAELAYFGARVLHPSTLRPAMAKGIPVRVLNSRRPDGRGTRVVESLPGAGRPITAIAFKRGITVLNVTSDRMLMAHGFLARLFEVFSRHETAVDMVTTSEVSVSMTLDDTRHLDAIRTELTGFGEVTIDADQAIVCLVGESIRATPGIVPRIFGAVDTMPVSMISHGASAINLSFVVPGARAEEAVRSLHRALLEVPAVAVARPPA